MKRDLKSQMRWCQHIQWGMAAALVVLIALICLWGLRPAAGELALVSDRVQMRRNQLLSARLRVSTLPELQKQTEQLRKRMEQFDKQVPHHQELPQLISDVTQISRRAELAKLSWRPESAVRRADEFTEVPVEFTFSGDYLGVFRFLSQVENMQRLTRVRKLDVQAKDGSDGQVDVQLTMNIYFSEE